MRATHMETDITFSLGQIIWLIGGITAIAAFVKWVIVPFRKLDDHETRIKAVEETLAERKKTDQFMMKSLNAIVNHMIDGNGVDQLKQVRDEYQQQIIDNTK